MPPRLACVARPHGTPSRTAESSSLPGRPRCAAGTVPHPLSARPGANLREFRQRLPNFIARCRHRCHGPPVISSRNCSSASRACWATSGSSASARAVQFRPEPGQSLGRHPPNRFRHRRVRLADQRLAEELQRPPFAEPGQRRPRPPAARRRCRRHGTGPAGEAWRRGRSAPTSRGCATAGGPDRRVPVVGRGRAGTLRSRPTGAGGGECRIAA